MARKVLQAGVCAVFSAALCGCVTTPPEPLPVTRLTPPDKQLCVESILSTGKVRTELAPAPNVAWRLRLYILTSAPEGWVDKGSLIYDGSELIYLANGATEGLMETTLRDAFDRVLELCP